MSVGKAEPKNPNAADYIIYARLDAGESLESIIANPPNEVWKAYLREQY
ncbi:hypothetical protein ACXGQP_11450 [Enterobacter oligotrophicus]